MRITITNRKQQRMIVIVDEVMPQHGLAFVMHGLGGNKDQAHIKVIAEAFVTHGYTTVRFDTTNTFGESDGAYENATTTNYYEDLEDAIAWAKGQPWYREPFTLAGHSLGGICTALYAERHPEEVLALAPIATVVSGKLSCETNKEQVNEWRRTGWREETSHSHPERVKRLPWSHMEDRLRYDLLPSAYRLTMPVLMIVGDRDMSTPPAHQQLLIDAIPGNRKELHIIPGSSHNFLEAVHLQGLHEALTNWLENLPTSS